MARHHAEIPHELVGLLAHHSAPREVFDDALQQARIAQHLHRCGPLLIGYCDFRLLRCQRLCDLFVAQHFQFQHQPAYVMADGLFLHAQLVGCLLTERHAGPRGLQLQRVYVQRHVAVRIHPQHAQIHAQHSRACVLVETAHAVLAVSVTQHYIFAAHLHRRVDGIARPQWHGRRQSSFGS